MSFLTANIDAAIVMTQFDLRGFAHPLGFREKPLGGAKSLDATTGNLMYFAAGYGQRDEKPTDDALPDYRKCSYEGYLAACQRLAESCNLQEKEAIQIIVKEIIRQSYTMKAEFAVGQREASHYLFPLEKGNRWGNAVLALVEAFEVKLGPTET
jgi:hypothetical protein